MPPGDLSDGPRVALVGFGRIGRAIARALLRRDRLVAVLDPAVDAESVAELLAFDSIYGHFGRRVSCAVEHVRVGEHHLRVNAGLGGAELIIDASGGGAALDLPSDAPIIITDHRLTAPGIVATSRVTFAGTCDSNAIGPLIEVVSAVTAVRHVTVTTCHPAMSYQRLLDGPPTGPSRSGGSVAVLGRSAWRNLIPKTTSIGAILESDFPALSGRVVATSVRTPHDAVCIAALTIHVDSDRVLDVSDVVRDAGSRYALATKPVVSSQLIGSCLRATVIGPLSSSSPGMLHLVIGYDNEAGYASVIADTVTGRK
jgi:glyceraldehyde 3-phosphate dehydrogenase